MNLIFINAPEILSIDKAFARDGKDVKTIINKSSVHFIEGLLLKNVPLFITCRACLICEIVAFVRQKHKSLVRLISLLIRANNSEIFANFIQANHFKPYLKLIVF